MLSFDEGLLLPYSLYASSEDEEEEEGSYLLLELPCGAVYFFTSKSLPGKA
jgi:hypothetical protein